jgi:error-prone DNA polymerase
MPKSASGPDFRGTGMTIGRHPMAHRRAEMNALGVVPATRLQRVRDGSIVRIAGAVIVRQRPGHREGLRLPQHGRRNRQS